MICYHHQLKVLVFHHLFYCLINHHQLSHQYNQHHQFNQSMLLNIQNVLKQVQFWIQSPISQLYTMVLNRLLRQSKKSRQNYLHWKNQSRLQEQFIHLLVVHYNLHSIYNHHNSNNPIKLVMYLYVLITQHTQIQLLCSIAMVHQLVMLKKWSVM